VEATPTVTAGLLQSALVGLGYYLSNSPWILGIGGFFGLYRPLVAGLIVGIIFGDPVKGAQIGAAINLLYIGFISAGGSIPADPSVAGWVGTALALAGGLDAGTAITLGVAVGLLGTIVFFTRMSVDAVFAHWADAAAEKADISGVARANWVYPQIFLFVISFFPATIAVYAGAPVVQDAIASLQTNAPWVLRGFQIAGGLLPAIGIALNMRFIFRGSAIPFYFIGYVFALLLGGRFFPGVAASSIGTIVVTTAIVGAAAAWIFVSLRDRVPESRERTRPVAETVPTPAAGAGVAADVGTKAVSLSRGDVQRAFWLWTFFSHSNYNYERLQGTAFAHAMTPIIRKLYNTPEEIRAALRRHLVFFNTEPNVGGVIHGTVIAMEEQRANGAPIDDDDINSVKSGLMGPLAGVGDSISQGTITPILLSIGIGIAAAGSILGPILFFVLELGIMLAIAYFAWMQGYDRGREGVTSLLRSGVLDRVLTGAGVLGNMVMGALTFQFVNIYLTLSWNIDVGGGQSRIFDVNRDLLNAIMPGLLPLAFTLLTWWLIARRRVSPIWLLVIYVAIAMIAALPILGPAGSPCSSILNPFFQPGPGCPPPPAA
jgi:PTS system mannose-specific IID component